MLARRSDVRSGFYAWLRRPRAGSDPWAMARETVRTEHASRDGITGARTARARRAAPLQERPLPGAQAHARTGDSRSPPAGVQAHHGTRPERARAPRPDPARFQPTSINPLACQRHHPPKDRAGPAVHDGRYRSANAHGRRPLVL